MYCPSLALLRPLFNKFWGTKVKHLSSTACQSSYKTVNGDDITALSNIFARDDLGMIYTNNGHDSPQLDKYNIDWLKNRKGSTKLVLRPSNVNQVSQVLSYCNEKRLAVCSQGGNTGLVGGSVPVLDEIVMSTERLNRILNIDKSSGTAQAEAGVILQNLDSQLDQHGMMVPLDLGSKASCTLGGNVSTNAGGLRLLRYGNMHGNVVGLEAVLADGTILDCMKNVIKDNAGYHLKNIFIGSEGTLGVVTKVCLKCPVKPNSFKLILFSVESYDKVLIIFDKAKHHLSEILSSAEIMDNVAYHCSIENLKLSNPLNGVKDIHGSEGAPFYLLLETSGSSSSHDEEKVDHFLSLILNDSSSLTLNGVVAQNETQRKHIWSIRERLAEAFRVDGHGYKFDVGVPIPRMFDSVNQLRHRLKNISSVIRVAGYGHLGDGDIHVNITSKVFEQDIQDAIQPFLYEWVASVGGSISGEHGIGTTNRKYLHLSKSREAIALMKTLKSTMDPNSILNPYKVII